MRLNQKSFFRMTKFVRILTFDSALKNLQYRYYETIQKCVFFFSSLFNFFILGFNTRLTAQNQKINVACCRFQ